MRAVEPMIRRPGFNFVQMGLRSNRTNLLRARAGCLAATLDAQKQNSAPLCKSAEKNCADPRDPRT